MSRLPLIRSWFSQGLPAPLKIGLWFATDGEWRRQYLAQRQTVEEFRRARRLAIGPISAQTNNLVASGPFAGMRYVPSLRNTHFTHKLLGTYEKELTGIVEEICAHGYRTVIDVGAAEGYYACGLTRRMAGVRMIAFELHDGWHATLKQIAAENGVAERLRVLGACTVEGLRRELADGEVLVICDIDGAEFELLDPALVPELLQADLLVEVHDGIRPNVSTVLSDRFRPTHTVEFIEQTPRKLDDLPASVRLEPDLALKAMDECRGAGNDWLWMRKKAPEVVRVGA